jgi:STAS-like domain of unknown function (DUF4325)
MKRVDIFTKAGAFAENKDVARDIRVNEIIPSLDSGESIILDFDKVDSTTQSFIHALISDAIRKYGTDSLDRMTFKGCNQNIQQIIKIVVEYMQEGIENGKH